MNKKVRVTFYISVIAISLSLLLTLSIFTFIFFGFPYRTKLLLPCIPSPFAFVGICATFVFGIFAFKSNYKHKYLVMLSLLCFGFLAVSVECFASIYHFNGYQYSKIKNWSHFTSLTLAVLAILFAALTRVNLHRRPSKVEQLEARVAELEKQISDNDKGE